MLIRVYCAVTVVRYRTTDASHRTTSNDVDSGEAAGKIPKRALERENAHVCEWEERERERTSEREWCGRERKLADRQQSTGEGATKTNRDR